MGRAELAKAIAARIGSSQGDALEHMNALFDIVEEALVEGGEVKISCFGKFETMETKARMRRNVHTNEPIAVPASRIPKFRPSRTLKQTIAAGPLLAPA